MYVTAEQQAVRVWCRGAKAKSWHCWACVVWVLVSLGCTDAVGPGESTGMGSPAADSAGHLRLQQVFMAGPEEMRVAPVVEPVELPDFPSRNAAIWGATGRDGAGNIWFGVSMENESDSSAELLQYDPQRNAVRRCGDVLSALRDAGLCRPGESQMKIHSRILQAEDGFLYFASSDLEGEDEKLGTADPKWGAHLWRTKSGQANWEHLAAIEKGVYAISGRGPWVYALGYFDHQLFQWNTETRTLRDVRIGSIVGHKSRNFFTDERGHAYVPRVRRDTTSSRVVCSLVEVSPDLVEMNETELVHYLNWDRFERHGEALVSWCIGIPAFCYMANGDILFSTVTGHLYRVTPQTDGPANVVSLGWLHPDGEQRSDDGPAGLFTYDGEHHVMAVMRGPDRQWQWVVYDLEQNHSTAVPLWIPGKYLAAELLLYGNMTRDNDGNFYLAGRYANKDRVFGPVLWRLRPGRGAE